MLLLGVCRRQILFTYAISKVAQVQANFISSIAKNDKNQREKEAQIHRETYFAIWPEDFCVPSIAICQNIIFIFEHATVVCYVRLPLKRIKFRHFM